MELEKRWCEMNKGNVELWKLEQKQNEKKWREKLIKEERKRRELEAQWEKVEVQFKPSNKLLTKKNGSSCFNTRFNLVLSFAFRYPQLSASCD